MLSKSLMKVLRPGCWPALLLPILICALARSQEKPYFVTYTHDLEEPGNLEIETKTALARPEDGNRFSATAMELDGNLQGNLVFDNTANLTNVGSQARGK